MKNFFSALLLVLTWLLMDTSTAQTPASPLGQDAPKPLSLLGRNSVDIHALRLSEGELRWLREKRQIVLGTHAPDHPPFSLTNGRHEFEGITADTLAMLASMLNLNVSIVSYANRSDAVNALQKGEIDLLADADTALPENPQFRQTDSYVQGKPVLIQRIDDKRDLLSSTGTVSLAVEGGYLTPADIARAYPRAKVIYYPSIEAAAAAVAFGRNDVLLVDIFTAHYLINLNYKKYLKIADLNKLRTDNYSFTLRKADTRLLELLNKSLAVISSEQRINILKRWSGGGSINMNEAMLNLTPEESRWLQKHPSIRIEVPDSFAPLSYFDSDGQYRGFTSEILDAIHLRTGLRFDIIRNESFNAAIEHVKKGESEVFAPAVSSVEREETFLMSRPFVIGQFVLVTRTDHRNFFTLESLEHKKLAITQGHALLSYIKKNYPKIQIVEANNHLAAMDLVATGRADAAVNTNFAADYYFSTVFGNKLKTVAVIDAVDGISPQAGFAVHRADKELHSILNKAILNISPDELASLANRWRTNANPDNPTWRDYRYRIYPIVIAIGAILALSLFCNVYFYRQMQRRRTTKYALASQLRFMEALINGTPHPIYVRDRNGLMLLCNESYLSAVELEREDVIGQGIPLEVLSDPEQTAALRADYERVMAEDKPMISDRHLLYRDEWNTIYHWIQPFKDASGQIKGVVCGWINISDRRLLLEDLTQAKQLADEANHAKSSFLAAMSHEIRTPMNAIIGMLELALKRADQGEMDRSAVEVAYNSANSLLGILGDILDLVRIESGHLTLSPGRANPRELCESVLRMYEGMAREKGLHLRLQIDAQANTDVLVDPLRFKQILSNLISNAIKFTDKGRVVVQIRATLLDKERLQLHISVVDSGIGIADEDRKKLFQLFSQVHDKERTNRGGTGLGLTICKTLCEMMGGSIEIHSAPKCGTSVHVFLSLLLLDEIDNVLAPQPELPATAAQPLRILVVDDHEPNRLLITQQLLFLGHQVREAHSGVMGLDMWRQHALDVVITDCQMPGMDGYELTRTIRREESASGKSPCYVVGFTANAQPVEYDRCLAAGMNDCMFKPVTLSVLGEHMAQFKPLPEQVLPIYDLSGLRAATGNDEAILMQILGKLIESNRQDLAEIERKMNQGDFSGLSQTAHRIHGGARLVNAVTLSTCCEALQTSGDTMASAADVAAIERLKNAIVKLEQSLLAEHGQHILA